MSVQVFHRNDNGDIEDNWIRPSFLRKYLEAGHVVDPDELAPTFEEADTNDTGKLSVEEVRAAAKMAGIRNWHNKKIDNLKKELGYV